MLQPLILRSTRSSGGALAEQVRESVEGGRGAGRDQTFNPYSHFLDNEKDFADVKEEVANGTFDSVLSPREFQAKTNQIRRENKRRETIGKGGIGGHILGTTAMFLNVSTLVPILGPATKTLSAGKNEKVEWIILFAQLALFILVGVKGNDWRRGNLAKRGFEKLNAIEAETPNIAIAAVANQTANNK